MKHFTDALFEGLLQESASFEDLNINSPEELLDWMKENITYELANDEYGAEDDPPTKTAEEVIETKSGHCAEQSYLEKKILDDLGYETKLIFVKENNSEDDYGADGSAHLFLTYIDEDKKQCWFEHSMEHMRGIHKYDSEEELLQDVAKNWWRYDENSDTLEVRFIPEPITGVDNWGLAQKCHEYPVETTFDISENVLEKDTLDESLENISYKDISDLDHYKKSAKEILGGTGGQSDNGIMDTGKEIYIDDKLVGYISFEDYDDVEGYNKVLGFGNFMILERGKGYGTQVIQNLVADLKDEYDLIYCFVDADNSGAINLYKKLGKVYDEDGPNDNGQYYVTFWDKNETED